MGISEKTREKIANYVGSNRWRKITLVITKYLLKEILEDYEQWCKEISIKHRDLPEWANGIDGWSMDIERRMKNQEKMLREIGHIIEEMSCNT